MGLFAHIWTNVYWLADFLGPLLVGYWVLSRQGFKATFMTGLANTLENLRERVARLRDDSPLGEHGDRKWGQKESTRWW